MRRLVVLVAALLVGCDDAEVASRALSALENGATFAEAVCSGNLTTGGGCGVRPFRFKASLLHDGSSLVSASAAFVSIAQFNKRGDPIAGCGAVINSLDSEICVEVDGGTLSFASGWLPANCSVASPRTFDMGTACTGFNLEAFGVE